MSRLAEGLGMLAAAGAGALAVVVALDADVRLALPAFLGVALTLAVLGVTSGRRPPPEQPGH